MAQAGLMRAAAAAPRARPLLGLDAARNLAVALVGLSALDAYSLAGVPLTWLAMALAVGLLALLHLGRVRARVPGTGLLWALVLWSALVLGLNLMLDDYSRLMPALATTPYPVFLLLRFLAPLAFLGGVTFFHALVQHGQRAMLVSWTVRVASAVSLLAVYIYVAQLYGLPEPPRNRMGTSGDEQISTFVYEFHRAMGTFREPSHLAEWLVLPFFLTLLTRERLAAAQAVLIGSTLLLTGSLTGIIGAALGLSLVALATNPFRLRKAAVWGQVALALLLSLAGFRLVAQSYQAADRPDLKQVLADRLAPVLSEGLAATNRAEVYDFVADSPIPWLGFGPGNANLILSDYLRADTVSSFLSLYLNYLYAGGLVGLLLLCVLLARPVLVALARAELRQDPGAVLILCAYIAWLVMFAVHAEELNLMFALNFALAVSLRPAPR